MSVEVRKTRLGDVYTIRYRVNGRLVRDTLGLKQDGWNKKTAKQEERKRIVEARLDVRTRHSFLSLANMWFDETARLRGWKPRTLTAYRRSIARLLHFHGMEVSKIRAKHVSEWIAEQTKSYSAKTVNFDISVLYAILKYAVDRELIPANPASSAPRPKNGRKKWRILTPEEIQKVDSCFEDEQARLIFRVLTRTAIRRHELRQLRVRDIDFDRCVIRIADSKTEEGERSIAIPESLCLQLKEWCEHGR